MVAMKNSAMNTLALASVASALTTSAVGTQSGCYWNVASVGAFNTHFSIDLSGGFSTVSDLAASVYTVAANPGALFARRFDTTNIGYSATEGAVTLTVPGHQTTGPISSSQLVTSYSDILYGSVRTVAKISGVPGTTHGFSFYSNDTQEIDFAFLTSATGLVHLTNEQVSSDAVTSSLTSIAPVDATTAFHEYRVDWVPGASTFYIDSVKIATLTVNVPTTPGFWLWNNWSNGNAWAAGPPVLDSVLEIKSIDAYFNRTSVDTSISSGATTCPAVAAAVVSTSSSSTKASSTSSVSSSSSSSVKTTSTSSASSSSSTLSTSTSSSSAKVSSTSSSASATATTLAAGAQCASIGGMISYGTCATGYTCTLNFLSASTCQKTTSGFL